MASRKSESESSTPNHSHSHSQSESENEFALKFEKCTHLNSHVKVGNNVFVAPDATLLGDIELGDGASVWYGSVLRADINHIKIGNNTNLQDQCCVHLTTQLPTIVGDDVTVGHRVILHGCTVGDNCLIGMGAILMDGCEIGANSIVGAGTLVSAGKKFPPNSVIVGTPAKRVRDTTEKEVEFNRYSATRYAAVAMEHQQYVQALSSSYAIDSETETDIDTSTDSDAEG
jgi:carbonic anhydrase/acetyltransferase-like protein (isoleucine patch superfamily)